MDKQDIKSTELDFNIQTTNILEDNLANDFFSIEPSTIEAISTEPETIDANIPVETPTPVDVTTEAPDSLQDPEPTEADDSVYSTLTSSLKELGIFGTHDDEAPVTTAEEFKDRWFKESGLAAQSQIYNFIQAQHGDEGIEAFNAIFVNGVPPKEYLKAQSDLQDYTKLDLEKESDQEFVYREYYKLQGWSDDRINRTLARLKDYGDLPEESKDLHTHLIELRQGELKRKTEAAAEAKQAQRAYEETYRTNVNNILSDKLKQRDFEGIPLTEKVHKEAYDYLTIKKWKLPSGEELTDFDKDLLDLRLPENIETKIKLGLLLRNKLDLSKVKLTTANARKDELFAGLEKKTKSTIQHKKVPSFFTDL